VPADGEFRFRETDFGQTDPAPVNSPLVQRYAATARRRWRLAEGTFV
jgi:hypothetical protein